MASKANQDPKPSRPKSPGELASPNVTKRKTHSEASDAKKGSEPIAQKSQNPKPTPGPRAASEAKGSTGWKSVLVVLLLVIAAIAAFVLSGSSGTQAGLATRENLKDRKEWIDNLMKETFDSQQLAARKIVSDVLLRNDRQIQSSTVRRAVVFHFGGGNINECYDKMEQVVVKFVQATTGGHRMVIAPESNAWENIRKAVFQQLSKSPRSIIVIQKADEVSVNKLQEIEDAFENEHLESGGERVDCKRAIFIIQTSLAPGMGPAVCGSDSQCTLEHKDKLVKHLKTSSQSLWTRQAFVARIRELVPFTDVPFA